jgi:hypothetical protein
MDREHGLTLCDLIADPDVDRDTGGGGFARAGKLCDHGEIAIIDFRYHT